MQSKGLDAQGTPLIHNDSQLDKLINMYLNRQILAPTHYQLKKLDPKESVHAKIKLNQPK